MGTCTVIQAYLVDYWSGAVEAEISALWSPYVLAREQPLFGILNALGAGNCSCKVLSNSVYACRLLESEIALDSIHL